MKAIILAAGKGNRLRPLTDELPKVLLKVNGKSILEHNLEILNELVEEVIIIVGYQKEQIIKKIGLSYKNLRVNYVEQKELLGTGHAIMQASPLIWAEDEFIIMNGDDLYSKYDIQRCLKHKYGILVQEVSNPEQFGVIEEEKGLARGIEEKPENPKSNLSYIGLCKTDSKIIELMKKQKKTERGEYEITCALSELMKIENVCCEKIQDYWFAINTKEQLEKAKKFFRPGSQS